jgi:hypothetical protein
LICIYLFLISVEEKLSLWDCRIGFDFPEGTSIAHFTMISQRDSGVHSILPSGHHKLFCHVWSGWNTKVTIYLSPATMSLQEYGQND